MKVLFVEDHVFCQEALANLIRVRFGSIEADCAETAAAAMGKLGAARVDLVLADFSSGDVCGRPGIEGICSAAGGAKVIAIDGRPIPSHSHRAQAAGAQGYVSKTSPQAVVDAVIAKVMSGGVWFPDIAARSAGPGASAALSPRQTEVLSLLLKGLKNAEIAAALGISIATVKLHVHAVLKASRARSRTELVLMGGMPE